MQIQGFDINSSGLLLFNTNKVNKLCEDICLNSGTPPSYNIVEERQNYGCYLYYYLPSVPYVLLSCKTASTAKYSMTL